MKGTLRTALRDHSVTERERERDCVCVTERERDCVCVTERERERLCVCDRERDHSVNLAHHLGVSPSENYFQLDRERH